MRRYLNPIKVTSTGLCVIILTTNVLFAHTQETNFWAERRKAAQLQKNVIANLPATGGRVKQSQKFASLPQNILPPISNTTLHIPSLNLGSENSAHGTRYSAPGAPLSALSTQNSELNFPFFLPFQFGTLRKISSPKNGTAERFVIHIQDVHMNPEAQANIGNAIRELTAAGKVDLVALEGAFSSIDLTPYQNFQNPDTIRALADYFFKEMKISGPIYSALTNPKGFPDIVGIDDELHYKANVEAYKQSASLLKGFKAQLNDLRKKINHEKQEKLATYNPDLLAFDQKVEKFRNGEIQLGEFLKQSNEIASLARRSGLARNDKPNIDAFLQALTLEESLDFTQVEVERTHLLAILLKHLSKDQTSALIDSSVAYRAGRLSQTDFYQIVEKLCQASGVNLNQFPNMQSYLKYVLISDSIDAEKLFAEVRELENSLHASLAKSDEERELIEESRHAYLTGKLLDFALTPEEWGEYRVIRHSRESGNPGLKASVENNVDNMDPRFRGDDGSFTSFESFYQEAEARDKLMAQNLLKVMDDKKAKVAVLVTGGFHSEGLSIPLKDAGITTINFVPKITKVDSDKGSAYLSVFTQEKSPLEKLFEGQKLFLSPLQMPEIFQRVELRVAALLYEEAIDRSHDLSSAEEAGILRALSATPNLKATSRDTAPEVARAVIDAGDGRKFSEEMRLAGKAISVIKFLPQSFNSLRVFLTDLIESFLNWIREIFGRFQLPFEVREMITEVGRGFPIPVWVGLWKPVLMSKKQGSPSKPGGSVKFSPISGEPEGLTELRQALFAEMNLIRPTQTKENERLIHNLSGTQIQTMTTAALVQKNMRRARLSGAEAERLARIVIYHSEQMRSESAQTYSLKGQYEKPAAPETLTRNIEAINKIHAGIQQPLPPLRLRLPDVTEDTRTQKGVKGYLANGFVQIPADLHEQAVQTFFSAGEFMSEGLTNPEWGFYGASRVGFGYKHFTTLPIELSPFFGIMMCEHLFYLWRGMRRAGTFQGKMIENAEGAPRWEGESFNVIEVGGENGVLAHDIMDFAAIQAETVKGEWEEFYLSLQYHFSDLGGRNMAAAQTTNKRFADAGKIRFERGDAAEVLSKFAANPVKGVVLSNEFFDACPAHQVRFQKDGQVKVGLYIPITGWEVLQELQKIGLIDLSKWPMVFLADRPEAVLLPKQTFLEIKRQLEKPGNEHLKKKYRKNFGAVFEYVDVRFYPELRDYLATNSREIALALAQSHRDLLATIIWENKNHIEQMGRALSKGYVLGVDYGRSTREIMDPATGDLLGFYRGKRTDFNATLDVGDFDISNKPDFSFMTLRAALTGLKLIFHGNQDELLKGTSVTFDASQKNRLFQNMVTMRGKELVAQMGKDFDFIPEVDIHVIDYLERLCTEARNGRVDPKKFAEKYIRETGRPQWLLPYFVRMGVNIQATVKAEISKRLEEFHDWHFRVLLLQKEETDENYEFPGLAQGAKQMPLFTDPSTLSRFDRADAQKIEQALITRNSLAPVSPKLSLLHKKYLQWWSDGIKTNWKTKLGDFLFSPGWETGAFWNLAFYLASVIPAQAGIQTWIPAFAGMTNFWTPAFAGVTAWSWMPLFAGVTVLFGFAALFLVLHRILLGETTWKETWERAPPTIFLYLVFAAFWYLSVPIFGISAGWQAFIATAILHSLINIWNFRRGKAMLSLATAKTPKKTNIGGRGGPLNQKRPKEIPLRDWKLLQISNSAWMDMSVATRRYFVQELFNTVTDPTSDYFDPKVKTYRDLVAMHFRRVPSKLLGGRTIYRIYQRYADDPKRPKDMVTIEYMLLQLGLVQKRPDPATFSTVAQFAERIKAGDFDFDDKRLRIPWEKIKIEIKQKLLKELAAVIFQKEVEEITTKDVMNLREENFHTIIPRINISLKTLLDPYTKRVNSENIPKTPRWLLLEDLGFLQLPPHLIDLATIKNPQDLTELQARGALQEYIPWQKIFDSNKGFLRTLVKELAARVIYSAKNEADIVKLIPQITGNDILAVPARDWLKVPLPRLGRNLGHLYDWILKHAPRGKYPIRHFLERIELLEALPPATQIYDLETLKTAKMSEALPDTFWPLLPKPTIRWLLKDVDTAIQADPPEKLRKRRWPYLGLEDLAFRDFGREIAALDGKIRGLYIHYQSQNRRPTQQLIPFMLKDLGFSTPPKEGLGLLQTLDKALGAIRTKEKGVFDEITGSFIDPNTLRKKLATLIAKKGADLKPQLEKALLAYWALLDTAELMPRAFIKLADNGSFRLLSPTGQTVFRSLKTFARRELEYRKFRSANIRDDHGKPEDGKKSKGLPNRTNMQEISPELVGEIISRYWDIHIEKAPEAAEDLGHLKFLSQKNPRQVREALDHFRNNFTPDGSTNGGAGSRRMATVGPDVAAFLETDIGHIFYQETVELERQNKNPKNSRRPLSLFHKWYLRLFSQDGKTPNWKTKLGDFGFSPGWETGAFWNLAFYLASVIPAQAGIQSWIPAFAGMTNFWTPAFAGVTILMGFAALFLVLHRLLLGETTWKETWERAPPTIFLYLVFAAFWYLSVPIFGISAGWQAFIATAILHSLINIWNFRRGKAMLSLRPTSAPKSITALQILEKHRWNFGSAATELGQMNKEQLLKLLRDSKAYLAFQSEVVTRLKLQGGRADNLHVQFGLPEETFNHLVDPVVRDLLHTRASVLLGMERSGWDLGRAERKFEIRDADFYGFFEKFDLLGELASAIKSRLDQARGDLVRAADWLKIDPSDLESLATQLAIPVVQNAEAREPEFQPTKAVTRRKRWAKRPEEPPTRDRQKTLPDVIPDRDPSKPNPPLYFSKQGSLSANLHGAPSIPPFIDAFMGGLESFFASGLEDFSGFAKAAGDLPSHLARNYLPAADEFASRVRQTLARTEPSLNLVLKLIHEWNPLWMVQHGMLLLNSGEKEGGFDFMMARVEKELAPLMVETTRIPIYLLTRFAATNSPEILGAFHGVGIIGIFLDTIHGNLHSDCISQEEAIEAGLNPAFFESYRFLYRLNRALFGRYPGGLAIEHFLVEEARHAIDYLRLGKTADRQTLFLEGTDLENFWEDWVRSHLNPQGNLRRIWESLPQQVPPDDVAELKSHLFQAFVELSGKLTRATSIVGPHPVFFDWLDSLGNYGSDPAEYLSAMIGLQLLGAEREIILSARTYETFINVHGERLAELALILSEMPVDLLRLAFKGAFKNEFSHPIDEAPFHQIDSSGLLVPRLQGGLPDLSEINFNPAAESSPDEFNFQKGGRWLGGGPKDSRMVLKDGTELQERLTYPIKESTLIGLLAAGIPSIFPSIVLFTFGFQTLHLMPIIQIWTPIFLLLLIAGWWPAVTRFKALHQGRRNVGLGPAVAHIISSTAAALAGPLFLSLWPATGLLILVMPVLPVSYIFMHIVFHIGWNNFVNRDRRMMSEDLPKNPLTLAPSQSARSSRDEAESQIVIDAIKKAVKHAEKRLGTLKREEIRQMVLDPNPEKIRRILVKRGFPLKRGDTDEIAVLIKNGKALFRRDHLINPSSPFYDAEEKKADGREWIQKEIVPFLIGSFGAGIINPSSWERLKSQIEENLAKVPPSLEEAAQIVFQSGSTDTFSRYQALRSFLKVFNHDLLTPAADVVIQIDFSGVRAPFHWKALVALVDPRRTQEFTVEDHPEKILLFQGRVGEDDFLGHKGLVLHGLSDRNIGVILNRDSIRERVQDENIFLAEAKKFLASMPLGQREAYPSHWAIEWREKVHGRGADADAIADQEMEFAKFHELAHSVYYILSEDILRSCTQEARRRYLATAPPVSHALFVPFIENRLRDGGVLQQIYRTFDMGAIAPGLPQESYNDFMAKEIFEVFGFLNGIIHSENPFKQIEPAFVTYFIQRSMEKPIFIFHHMILMHLLGNKLLGPENPPLGDYSKPHRSLPAIKKMTRKLLAMSKEELRSLAKEIEAEEFMVRLEFDRNLIRVRPTSIAGGAEGETPQKALSNRPPLGEDGSLTDHNSPPLAKLTVFQGRPGTGELEIVERIAPPFGKGIHPATVLPDFSTPPDKDPYVLMIDTSQTIEWNFQMLKERVRAWEENYKKLLTVIFEEINSGPLTLQNFEAHFKAHSRDISEIQDGMRKARSALSLIELLMNVKGGKFLVGWGYPSLNTNASPDCGLCEVATNLLIDTFRKVPWKRNLTIRPLPYPGPGQVMLHFAAGIQGLEESNQVIVVDLASGQIPNYNKVTIEPFSTYDQKLRESLIRRQPNYLIQFRQAVRRLEQLLEYLVDQFGLRHQLKTLAARAGSEGARPKGQERKKDDHPASLLFILTGNVWLGLFGMGIEMWAIPWMFNSLGLQVGVWLLAGYFLLHLVPAVIPTKVGIQVVNMMLKYGFTAWIPAFAGMTDSLNPRAPPSWRMDVESALRIFAVLAFYPVTFYFSPVALLHLLMWLPRTVHMLNDIQIIWPRQIKRMSLNTFTRSGWLGLKTFGLTHWRKIVAGVMALGVIAMGIVPLKSTTYLTVAGMAGQNRSQARRGKSDPSGTPFWEASPDLEELASQKGAQLAIILKELLIEIKFDAYNRHFRDFHHGGDYHLEPFPGINSIVDPAEMKNRMSNRMFLEGDTMAQYKRAVLAFRLFMLAEALTQEEMQILFGPEKTQYINAFKEIGLFIQDPTGQYETNGISLASTTLKDGNVVFVFCDTPPYIRKRPPFSARVYLGMDSLITLEGLARDRKLSGIGVDIGSGSGIQAFGVLKMYPAVEKMILLEIDARARNVSLFNASLNGLRNRIAVVEDREGLAGQLMGRPLSFAVSNPPFMPMPDSFEISPRRRPIFSTLCGVAAKWRL